MASSATRNGPFCFGSWIALPWRRKSSYNGGLLLMTDRRTARRYALSLPVITRLPGEGKTCCGSGKTRDMSTCGAYLIVDQDVDAAATLNFTVTLPGEVTGGGGALIRVVARVARVEKLAEERPRRVGVAAVIMRYDIIRNESLSPE